MGSSEMKKYEYKVESFGDKGYELINTNVVGHKIYVFLMREKP